MQTPAHVRKWAIGMALFAMFFGSGNLVFPLAVGELSGSLWGWAMIGFLLSGVLLPFAGVLTMVAYGGDYPRFFRCLGPRGGLLFMALLLTAWIPLGSGPRCLILSFSNLYHYIGGVPLWVYSLFYSLLLYFLTTHRGRALDLLGYLLTPLLLVCLGWIMYSGLTSSDFALPVHSAGNLAIRGLVEGYNTQDLIASFFFASTIIAVLKEAGADGIPGHERPLHLASRASILGIALLGLVYGGLIWLAASHAPLLEGVSKDKLLAQLVYHLLGPQMQISSEVCGGKKRFRRG